MWQTATSPGIPDEIEWKFIDLDKTFPLLAAALRAALTRIRKVDGDLSYKRFPLPC